MKQASLQLPILLKDLIATSMWIHPGDKRIRELIPFIEEPIDFLKSKDQMDFNCGPLMAQNEMENYFFHEYRGSAFPCGRDLPWIDVEKSVMIAVNRRIGDDLGIALDYRTIAEDPRVIGSDWSDEGCSWREIAPTFSTFCIRSGLLSDKHGSADNSKTSCN